MVENGFSLSNMHDAQIVFAYMGEFLARFTYEHMSLSLHNLK